jgi:HlyD family secretion protein
MSGLRVGAGILLAGALLLLVGCSKNQAPYFQGWVEAELIFVSPDDSGRIETLAVREGDQVEQRALVFQLDTELQQADVHTASAQVAEQRARIARLESAQQRREEVAVLQAQEKRAESAVTLSSAELERVQTLAGRGISSQSQLDVARANAARDRANLDEVRRQITVAGLSSRVEDIAAARESLAAAEARRSAAETKLARRRVMAPVAGTVQQVYFRTGEMVSAGKPVIALLPPANLKIRFFVSEAVLPKLSHGQTVDVRCDGCDGTIKATVSFISRTAEYTPPVIYSIEERSKLVFMIEARPERPEALRVGQPVSVSLPGADNPATASKERPK